jgi:hypothetical protein
MTMLVSGYKIEVKEEPEFARRDLRRALCAYNGVRPRFDYNVSDTHIHSDFTDSLPVLSACRWYLRGDFLPLLLAP